MWSHQLKLEDYLNILRRRMWLLIIPAVMLSALAYAVSLYLPREYTSQTVVLVQEQRVPQEYVRSVVAGDLNERLATMQEQILSRTRLQEIIVKLNLYKQEMGRKPMEELVARLQKSITISAVRPMAETHANGLPGFTIEVVAEEAALAQQICTEITSLFLQQNVVLRARRAQATTEFLSSQLADAKAKLDQQDARLAELQRKYMGALPDETQTNFSWLSSLSSQLDTVNQAIDRARQDRIFLESNLGSKLAAAQLAQTQTGTNPETFGQQLASLQEQLASLRDRYTDEHPDIIKLKADIAHLQMRMQEQAEARIPPSDDVKSPAPVSDTPQVQELRAQIRQLDLSIREKTVEQAQIQKKIEQLQSRLELSPIVQQQYKALTRDYQTALAIYNDLLKKQSDSEMATDLERRQEGEQFRVLDPPSLPEKPSFPNRPKFAIAGFMGGLALGGLIAFWLEFKDTSLHTERDVELVLNLATLASIPVVSMQPANQRRKDGLEAAKLQQHPESARRSA